jgi:hypothetical protein
MVKNVKRLKSNINVKRNGNIEHDQSLIANNNFLNNQAINQLTNQTINQAMNRPQLIDNANVLNYYQQLNTDIINPLNNITNNQLINCSNPLNSYISDSEFNFYYSGNIYIILCVDIFDVK